MIIRKLAILPAILIALGLTVSTPVDSFAQTKKKAAKTMKKKSTKKMKKKAADVAQVRHFG